MQWILGVGGFLLIIAFWIFGFVQLAVGFIGIEHYFSSFWAWAALLIAIFFRFTLPITIGAFYAAMNIWGWHWALAAIFVALGLLFIIPGTIAHMISSVRWRRGSEIN